MDKKIRVIRESGDQYTPGYFRIQNPSLTMNGVYEDNIFEALDRLGIPSHRHHEVQDLMFDNIGEWVTIPEEKYRTRTIIVEGFEEHLFNEETRDTEAGSGIGFYNGGFMTVDVVNLEGHRKRVTFHSESFLKVQEVFHK